MPDRREFPTRVLLHTAQATLLSTISSFIAQLEAVGHCEVSFFSLE